MSQSHVSSTQEHEEINAIEQYAKIVNNVNDNVKDEEIAKEEISKPEIYEQEEEKSNKSENTKPEIINAYQNILDVKQNASASHGEDIVEENQKDESEHEPSNKADAYNLINQNFANKGQEQKNDGSEQPKKIQTPDSKQKSEKSENSSNISAHEQLETKEGLLKENSQENMQIPSEHDSVSNHNVSSEHQDQDEQPVNEVINHYEIIETTVTQKDLQPLVVSQDYQHYETINKVTKVEDVQQNTAQDNVEQIISDQQHTHQNVIQHITRPDMTREDLAAPLGPQNTGSAPHQSPGGPSKSPGLLARDPQQPIPVQNTLEYNDERIFSRFDFDPQNPENVDPEIVLGKSVVSMRLNAPAKDLLTQGLSGVEQQQLHALEELYIKQLRQELLADKATAERLRLERELFDKTVSRQTFIHGRSSLATERLKRININRSAAFSLQSEYERQLRQKIARDDEKAEFLRQTRKFNEIQAQLKRYKDDEERQVQLSTFRDILALEKELKHQKLEGKYEKEAELLARQKAARKERAEAFVRQTSEQQKRAKDAFEQRKEAELLNLETQLEKYTMKSQLQTLNRSKSLNMTTIRAFSTNQHIQEVKDRGVAFRGEKLEKHKQQVADNETRAAINIRRLKQLRDKNVEERRQLHEICLQRSIQVREMEDAVRQQKENQRLQKEWQEMKRKEMEQKAEMERELADQSVRRVCGHFQFLNSDGRFAVNEDAHIAQLVPENSILRLPRKQAKQLVADYEERRARDVSVMHNTGLQMQRRVDADREKSIARDAASYQTRGRAARASGLHTGVSSSLTQSQAPHGLSKVPPMPSGESRSQIQAQLLQLMAFNRAREEERRALIAKVTSNEAKERLDRLFNEERRVYQERLNELQKRHEAAY